MQVCERKYETVLYMVTIATKDAVIGEEWLNVKENQTVAVKKD